MTDYPRFQWIDGDPSDSHHHYHGAPVVNLVLRIADWWLDLSRKHKREKEALSNSTRSSGPAKALTIRAPSMHNSVSATAVEDVTILGNQGTPQSSTMVHTRAIPTVSQQSDPGTKQTLMEMLRNVRF